MSQGTSLGHEQPPINRHLHPVALSGLRQKWKGRLWLWPWTDSLFPSAGGMGWCRSALHTLRVIILPLWLSHLGLWNQQLCQPSLASPPRDLDELVKAAQRQQHCPSSPKLWHLYELSLKTKSAVWPLWAFRAGQQPPGESCSPLDATACFKFLVDLAMISCALKPPAKAPIKDEWYAQAFAFT